MLVYCTSLDSPLFITQLYTKQIFPKLVTVLFLVFCFRSLLFVSKMLQEHYSRESKVKLRTGVELPMGVQVKVLDWK